MLTGEFTSPLRVEVVNDGLYRLTEELVYRTAAGEVIRVPAGFETDFASVPRVPFIYALFGGKGAFAAVVHDYLCRAAKTLEERRKADDIFHEALLTQGFDESSAWVFFIAVSGETDSIYGVGKDEGSSLG